MKISALTALEVLDSRGNPTVRAAVTLSDNSVHTATVPSGASTGSHEAVELRDDNSSRYGGKGVLQAVSNVQTKIKDAVSGKDPTDLKGIDQIMLELDGTPNKQNLGANAMLAVSQACAKAAAHANGTPVWKFLNSYFTPKTAPAFPRLMVNIVNGGKHAQWNFDIQEFMIVPKATQPSESVRVAAEIFHALGKELKKRTLSTLVGDEGGYSPQLASNEEVFSTIIKSAETCGYKNTDAYEFAIDAAATEFYRNGSYVMQKTNETISGSKLIAYYQSLAEAYSIHSFEDPFAEDDWEHFAAFTKAVGGKSLVVGDDLYTTDPKRIARGVTEKSTNAVLIKVNQIGTISETIEAIQASRNAGWQVVISHRSGETEDSFIADLAYGVGAGYIKTGSMSRSERLAKYNRLLEIEAGIEAVV